MNRRSNQAALESEPNAHDGARLHRESFVPLYFQLAEILKERIEAGEWPEGDRFPSERELCEAFAVSRTVVRPALAMLEGDGQLIRIKGRGTFVAPIKIVDRIRGLTRTLSEPIPEGTMTRVLAAVEQKPERHVAELLEIDGRRERVGHVTTVTTVDGRPLFLRDSFISLSRVPGVLAVAKPQTTIGPTPRALLGLRLDRSQVVIQTSFCSEFEAERLAMSAGGLVFLIRCIEYANVGHAKKPRAIEVARVVYRADIVELDGQLL